MKLYRVIKGKFDDIAMKAYVKQTIAMWEFEDLMNGLMSELKDIVKTRK